MTLDLAVSTLRPGLLVSLKTSVVGNVSYQKKVLESDRLTKEGKRTARWETKREIEDAAEHEAAIKTRSQVRMLIRKICAVSAFGLLCPESQEKDLAAATKEARAIAAEFNRKAKFTRVEVYVFCGRIAPDDVEAVRAINSEVRDLLKEMEDGISKLDVAAVRDAAMRARSIGKMLTPAAQERITDAIDKARAAAKKIVKAGEQAAQEIDRGTIRQLADARTAFLDLDTANTQVAKPQAAARAIDLAPETKPVKRSRDKARAIEME